jgi:hypothetical protein
MATVEIVERPVASVTVNKRRRVPVEVERKL